MFFVGLDLGQRRDFSALAIVERMERRGPWMPVPPERLGVRYLERLPLETPYPEVVARVCEILEDPRMQGQSELVVDATGVGAPVTDLLRSAGLRASVTAVTITAGERARGSGTRWSVPRKELLTGLESLLESGELKIARRLQEASRLVKELDSMRQEARTSGHDDLVLALSLACWKARRPRNGFGARRLPGI